MKYFERTMAINQMFGAAMQLGRPSAANAKQWLERIENELSPENLTCDGELRGAALRTKHRELLEAQQHCLNLLHTSAQSTILAQVASHLSPFDRAYGVARSHYRSQRTQERMKRLDAAVNQGFTVGARVRLSNGLVGRIVKVNRTRVKVMTDSRGLWNVPPRCMQLEK